MNKTRIVITGMGAVTPLGSTVADYWHNLAAGRCGVGEITKFDASSLPVRFAAQVKGFDPADFLSVKQREAMDDFMRYAYGAAAAALDGQNIPSQRTAIVAGNALNGMETIGWTQQRVDTHSQRIGPKFVPQVLGSMAAAQIAIGYKITGPVLTVNTACSSGTDAIILAALLLQSGAVDCALAVGAESALGPLFIQSLAKANALSQRNSDPENASRPFDRERDGLVMGEGAGAVLLETEAHALARGAAIQGELLGWASCNDGYHIMAPHPEGEGASNCMRQTLAMAGLEPEQIEYLNAHGTSTIKGDAAESKAIHTVFGDYASRLPVSSTKGATGHMMGACGVTEAIACIQAIKNSLLPPTLHFTTPDPDCALDVIPGCSRQKAIHIAMSNTFGFGGQDASLILAAY